MAVDKLLRCVWTESESEFPGNSVGDTGYGSYGGELRHRHELSIRYDSSIVTDGEALDKIKTLASVPSGDYISEVSTEFFM